MTTPATLTRAQKAAAILVAMGKPSASRLLKFFKQEELKALIEGARLLRTIPQSDLEKHRRRIRGRVHRRRGPARFRRPDGHHPQRIAVARRDERASWATSSFEVAPEGPPPVWPELEKLEPARLGAFLAGEHPQTAAMVLSKLAPQAAANVLLTLDKPMRSEIIKRMMTMADHSGRRHQDRREPAARQRAGGNRDQGHIGRAGARRQRAQRDGQAAARRGDAGSGRGRHAGPRRRAVPAVRLRGSAAADAEGAGARCSTACRPNWSRWRCAARRPRLAESVLSAIGARSRRMIESELGQGSEGIAAADIMTARKTIAAAAIRMAREGAFELPSTQQSDGLTLSDRTWLRRADKDSKTEEATEKKIRDTIEQGKLPHSQGNRDPRLLRRHTGVHRLLRQGRHRRSRHVPVDVPGEARGLADGHRDRRHRALQDRHAWRSAAPSSACWCCWWWPASAPRCCRTCRNSSASGSGRSCRASRSAKGWTRLFGVQGWVEFLKSLGKLGFASHRARLHAVARTTASCWPA